MIARSRERAGKLVRHAGSILVFAGMLVGCHSDAYYDSLAPSPTFNPHPHKVSHLKITVEPGSGVNRVEVYSPWMIGNLDCAPRRPFSGATIQKEVDVKENVEKIDGYYLATIRDDYYVRGKCRWMTSVALADVKLMRNGVVLAHAGGGTELFRESNPLRLVCIPPPHAPICELMNRDAFDRAHFAGVFNVTLEIEK